MKSSKPCTCVCATAMLYCSCITYNVSTLTLHILWRHQSSSLPRPRVLQYIYIYIYIHSFYSHSFIHFFLYYSSPLSIESSLVRVLSLSWTTLRPVRTKSDYRRWMVYRLEHTSFHRKCIRCPMERIAEQYLSFVALTSRLRKILSLLSSMMRIVSVESFS